MHELTDLNGNSCKLPVLTAPTAKFTGSALTVLVSSVCEDSSYHELLLCCVSGCMHICCYHMFVVIVVALVFFLFHEGSKLLLSEVLFAVG